MHGPSFTGLKIRIKSITFCDFKQVSSLNLKHANCVRKYISMLMHINEDIRGSLYEY